MREVSLEGDENILYQDCGGVGHSFYPSDRAHSTAHLKRVNSTVCKSHLNKCNFGTITSFNLANAETSFSTNKIISTLELSGHNTQDANSVKWDENAPGTLKPSLRVTCPLLAFPVPPSKGTLARAKESLNLPL